MRARSHPREGDDWVFGRYADQHENISYSGSSGFGGNAGSAETAPLAVACGRMYSRLHGAGRQKPIGVRGGCVTHRRRAETGPSVW